jgi:[ribosomal protein S5]-alanine N-acetyltransferase
MAENRRFLQPTMKQPILETDRLILRGFSLADSSDVRRLAGAREIAYNTLLIPYPYQEGFAEKWISERQADFQKGGSVTFAITVRATRKLSGAIGLGISQTNLNAELGYWIGVAFWNQGYCSEAALATLEYGFRVLRLNRIWAAHFARNQASGRVLQKIGMTHEGCLRQHILKWGEYLDVEQYGILRTEWKQAPSVAARIRA